MGKITIDKGSFIDPNVGIITANHSILDPSKHVEPKPVTLGDGTIVGAGSVVTKSFPEGYCVIAGNPTKIIKRIE